MPRRWGKRQIKRLVQLYERKTCLWNTESTEYKNQAKKSQALEEIADALQVIMSNVTVKDVKAKINNIRTQYQHQVKAIENSKWCGEANVKQEDDEESKLSCFDMLDFLRPHLTKSPIKSTATKPYTKMEHLQLEEYIPKKWDKWQTQKLLELYQERCCLWDTENPDYEDREKRCQALEEIRAELDADMPNICLKDVRDRIHNIRSQYYRELRYIENGKRSITGDADEDALEPKLWCFDMLSFLRPQLKMRPTTKPTAVKRMRNPNMVPGKFTKLQTGKFLELYEQKRCLWDATDPDFEDRAEREVALEEIRAEMEVDIPDITVRDVKMKIHNIRTQYNRELRFIKSGKRNLAGADDVAEPKLWFFDLLEFLRPESSLLPKISTEEVVIHDPLIDEEIPVTPSKRIKNEVQPAHDTSYDLKPNDQSPVVVNKHSISHEANVLAKSWALQYRILPSRQRQYVKAVIDAVLYEATLGTLHKDSVRINKAKPRIPKLIQRPQYAEQNQSSATVTSTDVKPTLPLNTMPKLNLRSADKTSEEIIELQRGTHRIKRRVWAKDLYLRREKTFKASMVESAADFRKLHGMDMESFEELLSMVSPYIQKQDTAMRKSISPRQRLSASLRYLASGRTMRDLKEQTAIAPSTLGIVLLHTYDALITTLEDKIKIPFNKDEWKHEAADFRDYWNFPNCVGAIIGKHIQIKKPSKNTQECSNYNKTTSILLMALVNANYKYLMIDVGANSNGALTDDEIFKNTGFFHKMAYNSGLDLPEPEPLCYCREDMPHVFVGDYALPLLENLMIPYDYTRGLTEEQKIYNCNVSKAHYVAEHAIGLMSKRFKVLSTVIHLSPEKAAKIILTCCYLHNFLLERNPDEYMNSVFDSDNTAEEEPQQLLPMQNRYAGDSDATTQAHEVRNEFSTYFNAIESKPWEEIY